ncbi:hypothetical protein YK56LOC_59100 [Caballeronia sp. HLA56]
MFSIISPTLPAFALLFVVVPTMPAVRDGVSAPLALSVVNAPVFGAVFPIVPGEARSRRTHAVVASVVLFATTPGVGAAGVPVKVGLAIGAYVDAAEVVVR